MKLSGKRVSLRATEPEDVEVIYRWENDPENWLVSDTVAPYSKHQILQFLQQESNIYESKQCRFMIEGFSRQPVGCVDLYDFDPKNHRVGIGILIDPKFRAQGLGGEALGLSIGYCFEMLEVHSVFAYILAGNKASIRMFESQGFIHNGTRREWLWNGHEFCDELFYQRLAEKV